MKIIIAKHSGFCFGVKNAVDLALKTAKENIDRKIFTWGSLIHNEIVAGQLAEHKITATENFDDISPNSIVLIRSHGVGKAVYERLEKMSVQVIDATCPFVQKIHKIVEDYYAQGNRILILGLGTHPEVIGINGWCNNSATIIDSIEEFDALKFSPQDKICVVVQTTYPIKKHAKIVKKIRTLQVKSLEVFDTICYTTSMRQNEAVNLSQKCDAMLVLGSKTSSNTAKLFEICLKYCENSFLIQSLSDLERIRTIAPSTVGIVTGASTPKELAMEASTWLKSLLTQ